MKILHVLPDVDSLAGGIPIVATHLAAAQAALGHRVCVAAYRKVSDEQRIAHELSLIPGFAKVHVEYIADLTRRECLLGLQTRRRIDPLIRDFEIVHIHGVWDLVERLAARAARRAAVPYVITPHGMLDPYSLSQKKWKKRLALAMGYRRMLDECTFLHALNADEQNLLVPLGLRCPVRVIPNGVFLEEFESVPPLKRPKPYILFLGRLHPKKGLDYLADAFAQVGRKRSDIDLLLVGPEGGAGPLFRERIEKYQLTQRVQILPPVFDAEKWAVVRGAAIFCLPSRQEGFSMAILESLACGIPVVISEQCHFPQVAQAKAGYVLPLNADAFAKAILELLGDDSLRQEMSRAAAQLVRSQYLWPNIAQQSIDAYLAR